MSQESVTYDASHIKIYEGLEAIRKRPGMYIGTTAQRGLHNVVLEAAGRGIDEILAGRATRVEVTLLHNGGVRVADDSPDADMADLITALTGLPTGWSQVGDPYPVQPLMGMLSLVNALSSRLVAQVRSGSGTTLTFWPDPDIFETTACSFDALADRFRDLAFLYRELDFVLTDERSEPRSLRLHFPDGVREMVAHLDGEGGSDIAGFEQDEPQMAGMMEIAWRWRGTGEERIRGFANAQGTPYGGTHESGFRDGVTGALTAYARERGLLAATDPDVSADAIGAGLTAVVSVKLEEPQFEGCTRGTLGNVEVRGYVRQAVAKHFGAWLDDHPQQAAEILNRTV